MTAGSNDAARPTNRTRAAPTHGHRLTLRQYKDMMGQLFRHYTLELGQFENMIIRDNWCAIRATPS